MWPTVLGGNSAESWREGRIEKEIELCERVGEQGHKWAPE
jgi:hypothetical protein